MQKCSVLMKLDYNVVEITNSMGELSSHYPSIILIPEYENRSASQVNILNAHNNGTQSQQQPQQQQPAPQRQQTIYESTYDANKLRDLINKARFAR